MQKRKKITPDECGGVVQLYARVYLRDIIENYKMHCGNANE